MSVIIPLPSWYCSHGPSHAPGEAYTVFFRDLQFCVKCTKLFRCVSIFLPRRVTQALGLLGCHRRVCAGSESFPSAIPAAQVPLRVVTVGKKIRRNPEGKQGLSVSMELYSLFPLLRNAHVHKMQNAVYFLCFSTCTAHIRPKAQC